MWAGRVVLPGADSMHTYPAWKSQGSQGDHRLHGSAQLPDCLWRKGFLSCLFTFKSQNCIYFEKKLWAVLSSLATKEKILGRNQEKRREFTERKCKFMVLKRVKEIEKTGKQLWYERMLLLLFKLPFKFYHFFSFAVIGFTIPKHF